MCPTVKFEVVVAFVGDNGSQWCPGDVVSQEVVAILDGWGHSAVNVFTGGRASCPLSSRGALQYKS